MPSTSQLQTGHLLFINTLSLQYQASQHSKSLVLSQQSQTIDKENDGPNEAKSDILSLIKREQDIAFAALSKGAREADQRLSILREISNKQ